MEKKYELTEETLEHNGHVLHRIKALINFGDVKAGEVGGWIESEDNLSHEGDCWVSDKAKVFENARVWGDAQVYNDAEVYGYANVSGSANIGGDAKVYGDALIYGNAKVCGDAQVYGHAAVYGNAVVFENAKVYGDAEVYGYAAVFENAKVYKDARIRGYAEIIGNAKIEKLGDYVVFQNFWSSGRHFTWTRSNDKWKVGCFYGTGEELIEKAYKDSEVKGKCYEMVVKNHSKFLEVLK